MAIIPSLDFTKSRIVLNLCIHTRGHNSFTSHPRYFDTYLVSIMTNIHVFLLFLIYKTFYASFMNSPHLYKFLFFLFFGFFEQRVRIGILCRPTAKRLGLPSAFRLSIVVKISVHYAQEAHMTKGYAKKKKTSTNRPTFKNPSKRIPDYEITRDMIVTQQLARRDT